MEEHLTAVEIFRVVPVNQAAEANKCLSELLRTSITAPPGTVKTELRSILTETLIKTMKLIIILELSSRAAAVMRPHRSSE